VTKVGRQRGWAAEVWESRWGGRPAAAQAASSVDSRAEYVVGRVEGPWMAAAGLVVQGDPGACHNCGETGHYKNGCPHPLRNGPGARGQQGLGRTGGGEASGACFVCGQLGNRAAQCCKRVLPPAAVAAAVAPGAEGVGVVDAEEFRAFQ
jgi:hypothetical protein